MEHKKGAKMKAKIKAQKKEIDSMDCSIEACSCYEHYHPLNRKLPKSEGLAFKGLKGYTGETK